MSRICIIKPNVRCRRLLDASDLLLSAKKEDNPEEALKEFRAIVDQEKEQGDWYVPLT